MLQSETQDSTLFREGPEKRQFSAKLSTSTEIQLPATPCQDCAPKTKAIQHAAV